VDAGAGGGSVEELEQVEDLLAVRAHAYEQRLRLAGGELDAGGALEGNVRLPEGPRPVRPLPLELVDGKDARAERLLARAGDLPGSHRLHRP
jgi:hypothetical protein